MDMDSMSGMDGVSSTVTAMSSMITSAASSSMDMDMDMATSTASAMVMVETMVMQMKMSFHTSHTETLFADGWTPSSIGTYAGSCIFLTVLAVIYRFTHVIKFRTERYLTARVQQNLGVPLCVDKVENTSDTGSLEKSARMQSVLPDRPFEFRTIRPWRVSIDIPLSFIQVILSGISYLLMLAVMTFNIGYFLSVLGGIFLGELLLGRFASSFEAH